MIAKSNRKNKSAFRIAVLILLALILLVFGNTIYKSVREKLLLMNYPMQYQELVEKYAEKNNIDKFLIYAIIKVESNFNENAVSNVGARGLMQIMSDTFEWIRYLLDDKEELSYDVMFDPQQNIRYGCYLVGYLIEYYGSIDTAICAYHAGIGNVDSWLQNSEYSSDGINLDVIPISDTGHYLDKVNNALSIYTELYMEESKNG